MGGRGGWTARTWPVLVGAGAVLLVLAAVVVVSGRGTGSRVAAASGGATPTAAPTAAPTGSGAARPGPTVTSVPSFRSVRTYAGVAVPVRLRIPAAGVDTGLERLGLAADGTIEPPDRWESAGWYERGPRPGQPGPAVIAGHVDSKSGPAVFFELSRLRDGDAVFVDRADGSTARFQVSGRQQVAKSQFPADLVYSPTLSTVLRLVTCGGTFDARTGHYRDNIIVTAVPA
jgi:hypothetical protein